MGKVEAMKFTRPGDQTFEWIFHEINWDVIELVRAVPPALCVLSCLAQRRSAGLFDRPCEVPMVVGHRRANFSFTAMPHATRWPGMISTGRCSRCVAVDLTPAV